VTLGLSGLNYGPGGGSDEATQTLSYKITAIPAYVTLFQADGTTPVAVDATLTLTELQGLMYKTVSGAVGTGSIAWTCKKWRTNRYHTPAATSPWAMNEPVRTERPLTPSTSTKTAPRRRPLRWA
jgi:hypothetical protein